MYIRIYRLENAIWAILFKNNKQTHIYDACWHDMKSQMDDKKLS